MSISACAENTRRGDPDRFLSAMTAPPDDRAALFVLYAFNLEIARAPWVTQEPLIAQMRLQFWADLIEDIRANRPLPGHEVASPLADLVARRNLPPDLLAAMVSARRHDIAGEPHASETALLNYIDNTAGNLMWLGALALGAPAAAQPVVRDFARGAGIAALLRALPVLDSAGRNPLPEPGNETVSRLARTGLAAIATARRQRRLVPSRTRPALLAGWQAGHVLKRAARNPQGAMQGSLAPAEFTRRATLLARASLGLW